MLLILIALNMGLEVIGMETALTGVIMVVEVKGPMQRQPWGTTSALNFWWSRFACFKGIF